MGQSHMPGDVIDGYATGLGSGSTTMGGSILLITGRGRHDRDAGYRKVHRGL